MDKITDETLKAIAEAILLSQVEDVEYLTVWEITSDKYVFGTTEQQQLWNSLSEEEQEELVKKVDSYISQATVTITFPED